MALYVDSSFLLAILLEEPTLPAAYRIWDSDPIKVSSLLLEAECFTVVRRTRAQQTGKGGPAGVDRENLLTGYLAHVAMQVFDEKIMQILRMKKALADCRTLDAIHIATALDFRDHSDEEIVVASFDERFRKVAAAFKFRVAR